MKRISEAAESGAVAGRRDVRLPDHACPTCGRMMIETRGTLRLPVNGEQVAVPRSPHLKCRKCGEIVLRLDEASALRKEAIETYRKKHGLLSAGEIRATRKRMGLTQSALSRMLHLGSNTISRWESGRNVQTAAMDLLLRLVRDMPGSIEFIRRHAA